MPTLAALMRSLALVWLSCAGVSFVAPAVAQAESVADFYRGKTIDMVIGYSVGGGYDIFARVLAQHMGKYIPGRPTIVPENMPGAGSRNATMYLYDVAPKDGTVIGTIGRNEPVAPLIEKAAKYDGRKFAWIGSITDDNSICLSWRGTPIRTWRDMLAGPFTVGALGAGDNTLTVTLALKNLFHANLKLVTGYPGTADLFLAMERGEVQGACGVSWRPLLSQHKDWIAQKKINVLVQIALAGDPSLAGVPVITRFVTGPEQLKTLSLLIATQAMARPFLAPPGLPEDRIQALRTAFDKTMTDPQFLADVKKAGLYVHPMTGAAIDALLKELYASPKDLQEKAAQAIKD